MGQRAMSPPSLKPIEIRNFLAAKAIHFRKIRKNGAMKRAPADANATPVKHAWELARSGQLRAAVDAARRSIAETSKDGRASDHVELHLVCASCAMRQGDHAEAMREIDAAAKAASVSKSGAGAEARVEAWRAELAYFQGRYSDANEIVDRLLPRLEKGGDRSYAAFALRIRIAILLARADYDAVAPLAEPAIALAEASGDDYVIVQVLNVLGAVSFDRATSKLNLPHARSHLSSLDPHDAGPMEQEAHEAPGYFERAPRRRRARAL
jgi:ATP/maltotriose-dependent transcriptional regulator MalT